VAWDIIHWGQFYTIFIIGFALGMDAFSLGIGLGMIGVRLRTIAKVSIVIGFFHILMPLVGIAAGMFLSSYVGSIASFIGGLILCFLGANMLWGAVFRSDDQTERTFNQTKGWGLFLFALSVSIDALSVGFSFGLFEVDVPVAVFSFGLLGTVMSAAGLLLGRYVGDRLGSLGEALGGVIILVFGIKFML
jgi:manganese efflux pump family protein